LFIDYPFLVRWSAGLAAALVNTARRLFRLQTRLCLATGAQHPAGFLAIKVNNDNYRGS
jgi:hypothetical protein